MAFYGPDAARASKVAVGIVPGEDEEVEILERWFSEDDDVRSDPTIGREIVAFLRGHVVRSVALSEGIIGCPHEEGVDYPRGEDCPQCPYWANRDRWTGELLPEE